jgi:hypothetical protein
MVGIEITGLRFRYVMVCYIHLNINLKTEITSYPQNYMPLYVMLEDHTPDEAKCSF